MKRDAAPVRPADGPGVPAGDSAGALALQRISIAIDGRALFAPIDVSIAPGECVTIMGPSGCGKSTLLAFLAGTIDAAFVASGRVCIGAQVLDGLPPEQRRLGILFQDDLLFPHLSVAGNLAFALPAGSGPRAARRARIEAALQEADLAGFADRDPATLSGGQRARVALMRTLLALPRALLLDEPFNRLDAQLRADFRTFVFGHARERGLPILLVTHDEADADAAGGRVIRLG
jgi:putative thiamine transport system ATP-binding protein